MNKKTINPLHRKLKKLLTSLLFIFAILFTHQAFSQANYSDVKVDELSDAQIRQLIERAESAGYNDTQLEQIAAAQGMKDEEIKKLRLRVDKLKSEGPGSASASTKKKSAGTTANRPDRTYNKGSDTVNSGRAATDAAIQSEMALRNAGQGALTDARLKIFGEELFRNGSLTFEPNLRLATPKSYVIGPDDQLLIDLSGDSEVSYELEVSPEGNINLEYAGRIAVGGLTIEQAISKIKTKLSGTYPGLRNGRTKLAVNIGNIRSIKVTVLGEIIKPGSYTLSSLSTVFNALYASGGPNSNGSFRKIQVIRGNRVISTIDIYDFLLNGIQKTNVRLQDQDVINVPVYQSRVAMTGQVKRPAYFEVLANESLEDVIRFSGGFNNVAYTAKIKVLQNTSKERKIIDVDAEQYATYGPLNGDKFVVEAILDRFENRVTIDGAVFRPGIFELQKGLTLKGLIDKSDGLREDAFLTRGYISRLNPDNSLALISFSVENIVKGTERDIPLQREDKVTISSLFDLREEYKVSIQGEVREPGTFEYADNLNLEALIQMAGGFNEGATPSRIEISRRIKNSDATSISASTAEVFTVDVDRNLQLQDTDFVLKPFDIVSIRSSESYQVQKQVRLSGEVLYPGTYTIIRKDERISDVIKRAGGLSPLAYVDGASLKRTGGMQERYADSLERAKDDTRKLLNFQRLKQSGAVDTTSIDREVNILRSDIVGINLERILKKPRSREDLIVEDGDVLRIPKQLQTVRITGEVLQPNSIVFSAGKSFKNYISGAGGFSYNAYKKGAYIVYSNGSVAAASRFLFLNNYPQVKPGAEIFVPKRAERERLTAQSWIGLGTAVASLGAIIVSLLR